jgi:hypothetical protein
VYCAMNGKNGCSVVLVIWGKNVLHLVSLGEGGAPLSRHRRYRRLLSRLKRTWDGRLSESVRGPIRKFRKRVSSRTDKKGLIVVLLRNWRSALVLVVTFGLTVAFTQTTGNPRGLSRFDRAAMEKAGVGKRRRRELTQINEPNRRGSIVNSL